MIIWLASYPKSGNTWIRAILTSLLYTEDGIFNIKYLENIKQYPVQKQFEGLIKDYNNIKEVMKYWIISQDRINLDNEIKFFKTHNALCKIENYPFTDDKNTLATIYIVRDPRNVITSITNYYNYSYEEAKKFIFNSSQGIVSENNKNISLATILGSWSSHYVTWTKNNKNLLLIKYEDLISNTEGEITKIIKFITKYKKINFNKKKIENCIKTTSFEELKKLEKLGKFKEKDQNITLKEKTKFFNLGKENKWENILDKKIKEEIEKKFFKEIKELKYI